VDFEKVHGKLDLRELLSGVPSAQIISGNPCVSVQVSIDARERDHLFEAVRSYCVVDDYAEMALF
jgi:hypothetical protein